MVHGSKILPLLIVALAWAVNLHGLAADSFWGDEILTAMFASQPAGEVIRWTAGDIHPPLYYLLAGSFTAITVGGEQPTPASDWLWRFPSALAVVLAVAATHRLARLLFSHRPAGSGPEPARFVAHSAALLLALSPTAVKYGQEARMHALFMALAVISTLLLGRAMQQPGRWRRWLAYGLAASAMLYTMYFGFLILAAQAAWLLSSLLAAAKKGDRQPHRAKTQVLGFSAASLLCLALYGPWWPVLADILRRRAAVGAIEGGVGSPLAFVAGLVAALGPPPQPVAWGFLLLFILGLLCLVRQQWPLAVLAGLWLLLPAALPLLLGDPRALQFRYAFVLPLYLSVISYAVWQIARWPGHGPDFRHLGRYLVWVLATVSFIGTVSLYQQVKPNWRAAAGYLDGHVQPGDLILIGPLWDEGRFIDYYYSGQAPLLTPAALVANIEGRAQGLRQSGGRLWAVNRFAPANLPGLKNVAFSGVVVSEPELAVYDAGPLVQAALNLAAQAVTAAYPWAAEAEAQGVLNPDPRTAQAAALRALGDTLMAAGRPDEAINPYQTAVDIFPGWVSGFVALAEAQEATGNLQAAAEAYRQAVRYNLKWHGPAAEQASGLIERGDWAAAIRQYRDIVGN